MAKIIVRRIDDFGRAIIPKKIRRTMRIIYLNIKASSKSIAVFAVTHYCQ